MTQRERGVQPTLQQPRRVSHSSLLARIHELEGRYEMQTIEFRKLWRAGDLPETPTYSEWFRLATIAEAAGITV